MRRSLLFYLLSKLPIYSIHRIHKTANKYRLHSVILTHIRTIPTLPACSSVQSDGHFLFNGAFGGQLSNPASYSHSLAQTIINIKLLSKEEMAESLDLMRGFVCGGISGWAQVFVMQPFEIIKVRLVNQSLLNPEYLGILHCFKRILKEEGLRSFYKGTLSPLLGYGIQGSMAFGSNQLFKQAISYYERRSGSVQTGIMPMSHIFLSGMLTGMVSTLAITPADHTRILMQKEVGGKHRGSLEAGRDIYRRFGLRGLYLGFNSTLLREVKANAVYFYSYEYIMRFFAPEGEGSGKAPIMAAFLAGGLAGCNSWLLTYPVDYVKTLMQSQNLEKLRWKSSWDCAVQQYKAEGYRTFFKGLGITLLRSFPVNGVAFFSYEFVMRRMGWKKQ